MKPHRRLADWLRRHAAEDRNSFTVTVAPAQAGRTFQIELPRWSLRVAGAALIAGFVLVVAGGILYGKLIRDALLLREIREENVQLRTRAERIKHLEAEIAEIDQLRRQFYFLAGVPDTMSSSSGAGMSGDPVGSNMEEPEADDGTDDSWVTTAGPLHELPLRGPVSRGFSVGQKRSPEHSGVDIAGPDGAPVTAAGAGVVEFAGWDSTYGNLLLLRHGGGWETKYGHNASLSVARGDSVRAGQTIALVGSTGKSSAPHLHFEIIHDGKSIDPGKCFPALGGHSRNDDTVGR